LVPPLKVCDQLPRRPGCPFVLDFAVYREEKVAFWRMAESVEMADRWFAMSGCFSFT
jgi:hypothetical protein